MWGCAAGHHRHFRPLTSADRDPFSTVSAFDGQPVPAAGVGLDRWLGIVGLCLCCGGGAEGGTRDCMCKTSTMRPHASLSSTITVRPHGGGLFCSQRSQLMRPAPSAVAAMEEGPGWVVLNGVADACTTGRLHAGARMADEQFILAARWVLKCQCHASPTPCIPRSHASLSCNPTPRDPMCMLDDVCMNTQRPAPRRCMCPAVCAQAREKAAKDTSVAPVIDVTKHGIFKVRSRSQ